MTAATPEVVVRILNAARDVTHRRGLPPEVIRCHPLIAVELHRAALDQGFGSPFDRDVTLAGMRVDTDEHLPERVWRLCDADDTLLLDCREGTPAL